MAVHPTSGVVLTGGADKNAILFNTVSEEVLFTLKGHSKKISAVALHSSQDVAVTASQDTTIAIWNTSDGTLSASIKVGQRVVHLGLPRRPRPVTAPSVPCRITPRPSLGWISTRRASTS
jgi:WD40 repeat protein